MIQIKLAAAAASTWSFAPLLLAILAPPRVPIAAKSL
jgi:hypothetical protein